MMATSVASTCPLVPPDIRLVSRVWVPAHMMPDSADRRAWRLRLAPAHRRKQRLDRRPCAGWRLAPARDRRCGPVPMDQRQHPSAFRRGGGHSRSYRRRAFVLAEAAHAGRSDNQPGDQRLGSRHV